MDREVGVLLPDGADETGKREDFSNSSSKVLRQCLQPRSLGL